MFRILTILATVSLFLPSTVFAVEPKDVKGRILLQVESRGEAWYVNPEDGLRYYMKDGEVAYSLMRLKSLGITNKDLETIPSVTDVLEVDGQTPSCNGLQSRLRGYILLQVESRGEAWYVDPDTCHRVYMKDGSEAYRIMRFLSLGITNNDLAPLPYHQDYVPIVINTPGVVVVERVTEREVVREPENVVDRTEPTTSEAQEPSTNLLADKKAEVASVVERIKQYHQETLDLWNAEHLKEHDLLNAAWRALSSCGTSASGDHPDLFEGDCVSKENETGLQAIWSNVGHCWSYFYNNQCGSDVMTPWESEVIKPLRDQVSTIQNEREQFLRERGYYSYTLNIDTWQKAVENSSLITREYVEALDQYEIPYNAEVLANAN